MPKIVEHRQLRKHVRVGQKGQVWTCYFFDGRSRGIPDIALGNDYEAALLKWADLNQQYPKKPIKQKPDRPDAKYRALPTWARRLYGSARKRSKEIGRAFTLTKLDFVEIFEAANGACQVSGKPFQFERRHPFSPSIDRIDSARGYEAGNVRLVALAANLAMNNWGTQALSELARAIAAQPLPQTQPAHS